MPTELFIVLLKANSVASISAISLILIILLSPVTLVLSYYIWFRLKRARIKRQLNEASKKPFYGESKAWLVNEFHYYKRLRPDDKIKFIQKLQWYKEYAHFISKKIDPVSDLDETQICACVAQITFGFPDVYLTNFNKIFLFDGAFESMFNKRRSLGEVRGSGTIAISLKAFLDGYADPNDGVNLGLHEMAHAVYIQNIRKGWFKKIIKTRDLNTLHKIALEVEPLIKSGEVTFISKYALVNFDEFFSVLTELFFEKPKELREFHHDLYAIMTKIYRQEPH